MRATRYPKTPVLISRRFALTKYLGGLKGYTWYGFFDRHDQGIVLYIPMVIIDSMYGRLLYLAGKSQNDIRGDYPALIRMDMALKTVRVRLRGLFREYFQTK